MSACQFRKPKLIWMALLVSSVLFMLVSTIWHTHKHYSISPALPRAISHLNFQRKQSGNGVTRAAVLSSRYIATKPEVWQEIERAEEKMLEDQYEDSEPEGVVITMPPNEHFIVSEQTQTADIRGWKIQQMYHERPSRKIAANQWSAAQTEVKDVTKCTEICSIKRSAVALFKKTVNDGLCLCQDYYEAQWSFEERDSFQVSINYNINQLVADRSPGCKCTTKSCTNLTCSSNTIDYWIGPPADMLNKYRTKNSESCAEESYSVELIGKSQSSHQKEIFCIPKEDWRGFWPLSGHSRIIFKVSRMYRVSCKTCMDIPVIMKPKADQKKILIAAYWRSGSTLSSELFAGIKDSMFIFEPLKFQGNHRYISAVNENRSVEYVFRGLRDIYNCDFHALPSATFNFFKQTETLSHMCRGLKPDNILDCLAIFRSQCAFADYITIKAIRAKLSIVNRVMEQFPNVKALLVVRDPRAMMYSWSKQSSKGKNSTNKLKHKVTDDWYIQSGKQICNEQLQDAQTYKELSSRYPGRFYMYHYEDLVRNSTTVVHHVYQNLNLGDAPLNIVNTLYRLTHGKKTANSKNGTFGTFRTDSEKTAYKWKGALRFNLIQQVDGVCNESYQLTGYKAVPNEHELHNENNHHRTINVD